MLLKNYIAITSPYDVYYDEVSCMQFSFCLFTPYKLYRENIYIKLLIKLFAAKNSPYVVPGKRFVLEKRSC